MKREEQQRLRRLQEEQGGTSSTTVASSCESSVAKKPSSSNNSLGASSDDLHTTNADPNDGDYDLSGDEEGPLSSPIRTPSRSSPSSTNSNLVTQNLRINSDLAIHTPPQHQGVAFIRQHHLSDFALNSDETSPRHQIHSHHQTPHVSLFSPKHSTISSSAFHGLHHDKATACSNEIQQYQRETYLMTANGAEFGAESTIKSAFKPAPCHDSVEYSEQEDEGEAMPLKRRKIHSEEDRRSI